jgi:hypothetical protein
VELPNGDLWAWFRTDMGFQYESFSRDKGDTWTQPQPSIFTSSDSPMSMKNNHSMIYSVFNPMPSHFGYNAQRNPFMMAWSRKGIKWEKATLLEDTLSKESYSYTAIYFTEENILLAYSVGECKQGRYSLKKLRIRKI